MANQIKVLHIIPNLLKGGAERLVLDICHALQKNDRVQVKLVTFSSENEYEEAVLGLNWQTVKVVVKLSPWKKNVIQVQELQKVMNDFKPNVIHTHLFYAELVSRLCRYPSARWFSHGHDNMIQLKKWSVENLFNKKAAMNYFERTILFNGYKRNGSTQFIAISKDTYQYFTQNVKPFKSVMLLNAVNYKAFFNAKKRSISGSLRMVNVGSFVPKKNQAFLVEVARVLKAKGTPFKMTIIGDGPTFNDVQSLVSQYGLENQVMLTGKIESTQEYLNEANLYVHSATYEPLGLVLLEAMAAGLPCVCLDGKGNRDLMVEGKNAFLLESNEPSIFADKINYLWNDDELYQFMSKFAKEYAEGYDIKEYSDKLLSLYEGTNC